MDLGLKGRRALVLGASRGLGRAIAVTLAAEGASVVLCGRNREALAEVAATIAGAGGDATPLTLDLADRAGVDAALATLGDVGIDILINNGGGPPPGPVASVESDVWSRQFEVMVNALFRVTAHVLPGMRARQWGRIVNIVSSGVVQPIPNLGISNALRASVVGWAKTLAGEVAADGVTVNSVLPGRIHTERVDSLDAAAATRSGKTVAEIAAASRATIPAGRYGTPQEFADVVAFLASERASYVTGALMRVDGGAIRSI
ncbi:SDR family oxidoreductase [Siculibacillus lacustris]|uniref:SDR family oxidoreductase n=1 Tax=Siculibacillus lacustris TaxID=1549641 RepID=A0A4Q9VJ92_9HYPH|nr:SDR family oxidoreductase [Siculibacillus lacustris]TBW35363.1 SDR family oxidoreductase [Siculibacillus lacustris]